MSANSKPVCWFVLGSTQVRPLPENLSGDELIKELKRQASKVYMQSGYEVSDKGVHLPSDSKPSEIKVVPVRIIQETDIKHTDGNHRSAARGLDAYMVYAKGAKITDFTPDEYPYIVDMLTASLNDVYAVRALNTQEAISKIEDELTKTYGRCSIEVTQMSVKRQIEVCKVKDVDITPITRELEKRPAEENITKILEGMGYVTVSHSDDKPCKQAMQELAEYAQAEHVLLEESIPFEQLVTTWQSQMFVASLPDQVQAVVQAAEQMVQQKQ